MGKFKINGGKRLYGEVEVHGAKNSILPILAATILNEGVSVIHNCPRLKDVDSMIEILEHIGCKVSFSGRDIVVDARDVKDSEIPDNLMRTMRSSIFLMGALIARNKKAFISFPGGCDIGHRPIDLHLKGLKKLGVEIEESYGYIRCKGVRVRGNEIHLDLPSVGATENIMLAATLADGITVIRNAAKEPEIEDLQNFLNSMGARITGAGTNTIVIEGVKKLHDTEYTIIPDRIVAGTYLCAAAMTRGELTVVKALKEHLEPLISKLKETGCELKTGNDYIKITCNKRPKAVDMIVTLPYPGFPTDLQPQIVSVLSIAEGTSIVTETIFDNRFKYTEELVRMGADIKVEGRVAVIRGVDKITGAKVLAKDLRGGVALVIAGLGAEGTTVVEGAEHIDRGYESLEKALKSVGADIVRIM
ncbi:UDP-N-acetylglucosamine 1-carboxyvinyltransferase [Caldanaerobacter subterraneus]|jgi:UDP-N-acetylglucosamine 1-carboxyvinyltransferase|uniref:UDP-N-acetylglucosamine 1-carboxyvinyltransferase 2 n=4 Tax=Caldanaerobacter subterraneus TaxID=911092 RepID=MURA2_CALS4|nr:UDP-N-acetylglucosamine 1-carboxyvinyltransferase [Caldanaerobacter subterraneus]Q8R9G7.1 RecName: Full=UDP-N-acetylglucosamine 1-carboxyvinyltransferase 2; AltName: Full=Enoylpyruvate transferase 2; AltName: Full=UDP-N-acetylglucosamine enolpyruvyl transferase 2; Short=EPT 2 [Caldanaerobacter subterraneus subsp. tengcongensis MB4]MDK2794730.1 UDP-N-acetylglucosamine 1-carboxyvinyltransferase [Caldanaerobacter sp.]AAM24846.1 UDP-N-acetylglucosamine enolpyruvyl transferase [Caldanaerobacter su